MRMHEIVTTTLRIWGQNEGGNWIEAEKEVTGELKYCFETINGAWVVVADDTEWKIKVEKMLLEAGGRGGMGSGERTSITEWSEA